MRERYERGLAAQTELIEDLKAAGLSQNRALQVVGCSKSAYHYRTRPRPRLADPVPHKQRSHPARLTTAELDRVAALLRESSRSVEETFYDHLDSPEGYVASLSTFYRVRHALDIAMARTGRNRHRPRDTAERPAPRLQASQGSEVVCWDITFLPGFYRGQRYALYLAIYLHSRKIAGWSIQEREDKTVAAHLIEAIIQADPRIHTIHCDNGAAMRSHQMAKVCLRHHVAQSFIRPGVSNDNAANESFFRTLKYAPTWPTTFDSLEAAQTWFTRFVDSYNNTHHHTSLQGYTPTQVHDGTWVQVHAHRQAALDAAYQAHPERYRRPPTAKTPPESTSINLADNHTHTQPVIHELITG